MAEAATGQRERREKLEDILVVDCDVHVHESPGELAPYCDMPWRKALENVADVDEYYLDIPGFSPGTAALEAKFPSGHEGRRMVHTPEQMREELDDISVDIGILFPDHLLKLPVISQVEYAAALARAYNAWLVDKWCLPEQGLLGCVVACPHDPEDAAKEIRRYAAEPGVVGVYLPCAGLERLWGHRQYDPIYEAAQEADLPVLLHSVTVIHPVFPFNTQGFETEFGRHICSHTFSIMANLVHMITTGVPVRFPELRVAVTEAGISWVPFLMQRMDKEYLERRREVPFLTEKPSHYLKKMYFATQPVEEPDDLKDLVTLMELYDGEDNTIFASDWPHHDFDHPSKVHQIPFSNGVRRKVFGENALRLFNIDAQGRRLNL
ncbi:amidohydrolase family protein [soil metagenome]|jgi:predicted TIM-barrel fold metal-dependent hydrolase